MYRGSGGDEREKCPFSDSKINPVVTKRNKKRKRNTRKCPFNHYEVLTLEEQKRVQFFQEKVEAEARIGISNCVVH